MTQDQDIINKQRAAFKNFMQTHKLKALPWAKKAGIAESTIRNYINGLNQSLTGLVLEKLAKSINVSINDLIGFSESDKVLKPEDKHYKLNSDLFVQSFIKAEELIEKSKINATSEEKAKMLLALYEISVIDSAKNEANPTLSQTPPKKELAK